MLTSYRFTDWSSVRLPLLLPVVALVALVTRSSAAPPETDAVAITAAPSPLSTFEGVLRVHPKFLYRYYIVGQAEAQHFALFDDGLFDAAKLANIPLGSTIEVTGRLATRLHAGGTPDNPSPFPRAWYVYMDVIQVKFIRAPDPLPKSDKSTPTPVSGPPGTLPPISLGNP